ncbi:Cupredoxin [Microthyrium microscopicum]|uniref:Cupredoxin n=1 Tax=Microthyrium microscopicum TaxID=703497 RepID=A0A6A6UTY6_9PEZI|nr:Cupredoxin [Microthyrium microscopicum]
MLTPSHTHWSLALLLAFTSLAQGETSAPRSRRSPVYKNAFQQPLPIPAIKEPLATYTHPDTGVPIDFYQLEVKDFEKQFYPELKKAKVKGYDGTFPGPTFRVEKGRETVVRLVNRASNTSNLHLHGSYSRSPWDGWADDVVKSGEYKDHYYPNSVNGRTIWYHDHSNHFDAVNVYSGLFGMYQIIDSKLDEKIGIPSGPKYDIPLILSSHYFTADGDLTDESKEKSSIYGDTWLANGQIQPFLQVEPRKYRFHVLNGAVSRTLNFTIEDANQAISFSVIGSDSGIMASPASTKSLVATMAERWEIVVDFAPYAGKSLTMRATNMWSDMEFADSDKIMQFRVGGAPGPASRYVDQKSALPERFAGVDAQFPVDRISATRDFKMVSHMDLMWGINSYHMDDPMKRVLMRPPLGTIEKLIFRRMSSGTGSTSYWTHSIHLHLVDMKIVSRRKEDPTKLDGRDYLESYEKNAVKDIILLGSNEVVEVLAKYQPYPGVYMWHCHNAVHEDNGMMAVMNVTRLKDFGYTELDSQLEDPMDQRFRAQKYTGTDIEDVKTKILPGFAKLKAYPDPHKLEEFENKYWSSKSLPSAEESGENVVPNTDPDKQAMHNSHHGTATSTGTSPQSTTAPGAHGNHHGS